MNGPRRGGAEQSTRWAGRVPVTVVRASRHALTGDWSVATQHVIDGCLVAPAGSTEPSDRTSAGDQVSTRRDVYAPPDADVAATDRVRFPDDTADGADGADAAWHVVGDPARWGPGTVFTVERVTG